MARSNQTRKSMSLALQIRENTEIDDLDDNGKKRLEWENAVADELEDLYNRQLELDEKIENVLDKSEPRSPQLNVTRQDAVDKDFDDKLDAQNTHIENILKQYKIETQQIIAKLEKRIINLENENDKLRKEQNSSIINNEDIIELKQYINNQLNDLEHTQNAKIDTLTYNNNNNPNSSIQKMRINIPKFKGTEFERPVKFLNELQKYIAVIKPNNNELLFIISQALEDAAQNWFYIHEPEIEEFDDFAIKFKEQYWNTNIQRAAYRKIEIGQFYPGGKFTRVNYAIYLFGLARELDLNLPDDQLAAKISEHFERSIKYAFNGFPSKDKTTLFKILGDFDSDDAKNKLKSTKLNKPFTFEKDTLNKEYTQKEQNKDYKQNTQNSEQTYKSKKPWQTNAISSSSNRNDNFKTFEPRAQPRNSGTVSRPNRNVRQNYELIATDNLPITNNPNAQKPKRIDNPGNAQ